MPVNAQAAIWCSHKLSLHLVEEFLYRSPHLLSGTRMGEFADRFCTVLKMGVMQMR